MRSLLPGILCVLAATAVACGGPGSPSGPLDSGGGGGSDGTTSGKRDVGTPMQGFDAPIQNPVDAFSLDEAGSTSTCTALQAYAACDSTADPCAQIDAKDCIAFDAMYNLAGRRAISNCYSCQQEAGTGAACVYLVGISQAPGAAQTTLASHFCNACAGDAAAACAAQFYSTSPPDGGTIGLGIALSLTLISDQQLATLDSMCTASASQAGVDCADTWGQCAAAILNIGSGAQCMTGQLPDGGNDADPGGA